MASKPGELGRTKSRDLKRSKTAGSRSTSRSFARSDTRRGRTRELSGTRDFSSRTRSCAGDGSLRRGASKRASKARRTEDLEAGSDEEDSDWDFTDIKHLFGQLFAACKRRARAAKVSAAQAVAHELHEGLGKTNTASRIRALRKLDRSEIRRRGRQAIKKAYKQTADKASDNRAALAEAMKADTASGFGIHRFVIHNPGKVRDFFDLQGELKVGGTAKVYRAVERSTKVARAIKRVGKGDFDDYVRLLREVATLKALDHPNIVKLFETFEDSRNLYMVLELCEGGDLLDRLNDPALSNLGCLSETQASVILRCMFMTLNYLFANGFVHRDIKPENILLKDKHNDILMSAIRMGDFGYSRRLPDDERELLNTKVGSPYYIAPEVLEGAYDERCDLWSCGVLCYTLLCGYPPFAGDTDADTLHRIKEGKFVFHKQAWQSTSKSAKHLIRRLLEKDVDKRMTLRRALSHPWIKARGAVQIERLREETVERLISFHGQHRLRRCAMLAVAYQLESKETRSLLDLFQGLDSNGDGLLTKAEFVSSVKAISGLDAALIEEMVLSLDTDGSGVIGFSEFVAATLEKDMYIKNHAAMVRAFRCFDQDDGGSLSMNEVMETLALEESDRPDVERSFAQVDLNEDGEMDYSEFHSMLQIEDEVTRELEKEGSDDSDGGASPAAPLDDADGDDADSESQKGSDSSASSDEEGESESDADSDGDGEGDETDASSGSDAGEQPSGPIEREGGVVVAASASSSSTSSS